MTTITKTRTKKAAGATKTSLAEWIDDESTDTDCPALEQRGTPAAKPPADRLLWHDDAIQWEIYDTGSRFELWYDGITLTAGARSKTALHSLYNELWMRLQIQLDVIDHRLPMRYFRHYDSFRDAAERDEFRNAVDRSLKRLHRDIVFKALARWKSRTAKAERRGLT